jgi:hypothetical protein
MWVHMGAGRRTKPGGAATGAPGGGSARTRATAVATECAAKAPLGTANRATAGQGESISHWSARFASREGRAPAVNAEPGIRFPCKPPATERRMHGPVVISAAVTAEEIATHQAWGCLLGRRARGRGLVGLLLSAWMATTHSCFVVKLRLELPDKRPVAWHARAQPRPPSPPSCCFAHSWRRPPNPRCRPPAAPSPGTPPPQHTHTS